MQQADPQRGLFDEEGGSPVDALAIASSQLAQGAAAVAAPRSGSLSGADRASTSLGQALSAAPADALSELPYAIAAMQAIDELMEQGRPLVNPFSGGKDSSIVVNLTLQVARERQLAGKEVTPVLVIHSDTGVDNPESRKIANGELAKIEAYAQAHGLPVSIRVGQPLLYTSFPVRVISGRALPTFPNSAKDCAVELKVKVGRRLTVDAFDDLSGATAAPVVMTGVRRSESAARGAAVEQRGEISDAVWQDGAGRSYMSPILEWDGDQVWEYLGYAHAGLIPSFSDFSETMQFYRDAGGSSCAVVGAMRLDEEVSKQKGGCGARSGCWSCTRVAQDASLKQMIESDPQRYGYLRGLGLLRDFIAATQYDWSRRNFVGRTIDKEGAIAIQADTYSPQMLEELLYYVLTLQAIERAQSAKEGVAQRFQIVGPREIIAIDALWSLYGLHPPFHALHIMGRVEAGDFRLPPRHIQPMPRTPVPRYGKLFVGADWADELLTGDPKRDRMISGGIRSHMLEMFEESCGVGSVAMPDGTRITGYDTHESFEVDEEAAGDFIGCGMADEMIARFHDQPNVLWTEGVKQYLAMGMVMPAAGGLARWHRIAKRTDWLQRHGLHGQVDVTTLQRWIAQQQAQREAGGSADDHDRACPPAQVIPLAAAAACHSTPGVVDQDPDQIDAASEQRPRMRA